MHAVELHVTKVGQVGLVLDGLHKQEQPVHELGWEMEQPVRIINNIQLYTGGGTGRAGPLTRVGKRTAG